MNDSNDFHEDGRNSLMFQLPFANRIVLRTSIVCIYYKKSTNIDKGDSNTTTGSGYSLQLFITTERHSRCLAPTTKQTKQLRSRNNSLLTPLLTGWISNVYIRTTRSIRDAWEIKAQVGEHVFFFSRNNSYFAFRWSLSIKRGGQRERKERKINEEEKEKIEKKTKKMLTSKWWWWWWWYD